MSTPLWKAWPLEWEEDAIRVRAHTRDEALRLACEHFSGYGADCIRTMRLTARELAEEAAPELLAALEEVLALLDDGDPLKLKAQAIVAKATGEAP